MYIIINAEMNDVFNQLQEFNLNTNALEEYFLLISAMEDNLVEFKKLQVQLTEVKRSIFRSSNSHACTHTHAYTDPT